ncbi:MAG TPA: malto-oligosyltrehalose trehalohydrolase [Acidobacteriaceae bacterium]
MHRFEIWAPRASKLFVQVNGDILPMQGPDEFGYWRLAVDFAEPGMDYGFLIDDDPHPYPDPRSLWQPNGVHALSRIYDSSSYPWRLSAFVPRPLSSAIVYELHIGTFTPEGTFDTAVLHLDHLAALGVTHIELMPVAAFAGQHGWGYDGVALFAVHQPYGGPDALKRFVDAAHQRGLAVLLDVVYNHFGPSGNYTGKFAPYITESHHTPWGGAVNFEEEWSSEVRRFFCDNALMWMRDFHIDGLRLDAVHAFVDRSAIHFLQQLAEETDTLEATLGRPLTLIAESDLNDPRIVTEIEAGGFGIDAQWSDDFHHALFAALALEKQSGYYSDFGSIEQIAKALTQTFVFDGAFSDYRRRAHGRSAAHLSQHRFLGYIQNHDQVGNRAIGERIHIDAGLDRAKIAAALVLTAPFIPMLFQGEEWAASTPFQYFADHEDPELARLVSEGRKREFSAFGWPPEAIPDPEKRETFLNSKLNWNEVEQNEHGEMLAWYRSLIHLRHSEPALNQGQPGHAHVLYDEAGKWLIMTRGEITVVCNLGADSFSYKTTPASSILLSAPDTEITSGEVRIPANGVAILRHG